MALLIPSGQIAIFTGIMGDHFETFSNNRNITIFKEPTKTITTIPINDYPGYENSSNETNITYTTVSGIYPAIIRYKKPAGSTNQDLESVNMRNLKGDVTIKVKQDCFNYVKNGKTEYFEFDNKQFNQISDEAVQDYLGLKFYYFGLESTK